MFLDLQERFAFAKNLCLLYEPDERRMILKEKLKFIDCKAVLSEKENEAQNKTTKISLSISAVLLLAIIFVFVLLARKNKLKFYRAHKMVGFDLGDEELDAKSAQPKGMEYIIGLNNIRLNFRRPLYSSPIDLFFPLRSDE